MKKTSTLLALSTATLLSGCVIAIDTARADVHLQKELTINSQQLTQLNVEAGAGSLFIEGKSDIESIQVQAEIYTDSKDNYQLTLNKNNGKATLVAKINSSAGFWQGDSPRVNIRVFVPQNIALNITDGSGDMNITNINNDVIIKDGSGGIDIKHINGRLTINDGSGELNVKHINGETTITDGSGDLALKHITGDVTIDDDSGSIYAKSIQGNANITDGSGDLTVEKVSNTVTIDDGSGDINVKKVGNLNIIESGSGGLHVNKVSGNFSIDS